MGLRSEANPCASLALSRRGLRNCRAPRGRLPGALLNRQSPMPGKPTHARRTKEPTPCHLHLHSIMQALIFASSRFSENGDAPCPHRRVGTAGNAPRLRVGARDWGFLRSARPRADQSRYLTWLPALLDMPSSILLLGRSSSSGHPGAHPFDHTRICLPKSESRQVIPAASRIFSTSASSTFLDCFLHQGEQIPHPRIRCPSLRWQAAGCTLLSRAMNGDGHRSPGGIATDGTANGVAVELVTTGE